MLFKQHHHLLQHNIIEMYSSTQSDEGRPHGPRGLAAVMEAALTSISGILFVNFLLSVLCLSSLPGVRGCGGRHGFLGRRLGLPVLFVFSLLVFGCV